MKITVGIIVLNGDFFLRQVLESIYDHAHAICIAEGPVGWWVQQGISTSTDHTNEILESFPDPENKIRIVHDQYQEKTEQCQAWFAMVPTDTDYVLAVDADEIHSPENLTKLIDYLKREQPNQVGFQSDSFYGGFDRIIGGFERAHSFTRVLRYQPGCYYLTHRQPTLAIAGMPLKGRSVTGIQLFQETGITMWHGSYVSAFGVANKLRYYENAIISAGNCIPNYFKDIWMQWVLNPASREAIEKKYLGVQEFMPAARNNQHTYTQAFEGTHAPVIIRDWKKLHAQFWAEVNEFNGVNAQTT